VSDAAFAQEVASDAGFNEVGAQAEECRAWDLSFAASTRISFPAIVLACATRGL
jgi:hypothetical protein